MMTAATEVALGHRMSDLGEVSRKLVAVFAADVEGYSRLMGADEVGTREGLTERRVILEGSLGTIGATQRTRWATEYLLNSLPLSAA